MPENKDGTNFVGNEVPNRYDISDDDIYKLARASLAKMEEASENVASTIIDLNKAIAEQKQVQEEHTKLTKKINVEQAKEFAQQQKVYQQKHKDYESQKAKLTTEEQRLRREQSKINDIYSSTEIVNEFIRNIKNSNKNTTTNNISNSNNNPNSDSSNVNSNKGKTESEIIEQFNSALQKLAKDQNIDLEKERKQADDNVKTMVSLQTELNKQKEKNSKDLTEEQKYYNERNKHLIELVSKQKVFFDVDCENEIYLQELRVKNLEEEHDRQANLIKLQNTGFKDIFKEANKGSANIIETLKKSFDGYHQHMMKKWDEIGGAKGSIAKNVSSALTSVVNTAIDFGTKLLTEGISEIQSSYASTGMNIGNAIYADRDEIKSMYGGFADELAEDGWDKATSATKVADQAYTLTTMGITEDNELKTMAQAMTEANLMTGGQLNFNTDEQIKDYHNQYLQLLEQNENDVEKTNEDFKQVIMTQASYWVNTTETYGNAIGLVNGKFTEMADQASQLAQRIHNADPTIDTDGIRKQLMSAYTAVAGAVGDIAPDLVAASQNAISSLTDTGVSGDVLNILGGTTVADELKDTIASKDFGKAYAQILQGAMELQQSGDMTGTEALANNLGINGNELNAIAIRYSDENGNFNASAFENAIMTGYNQNMQGTGTSEFQDAKQGRQTDTGFTVEEGLKNMTLNDKAMDIWGAIPTSLADGDKLIITAINTGADLVKGAITSGIDLIIDQFVKGNVISGASNLLGGAMSGGSSLLTAIGGGSLGMGVGILGVGAAAIAGALAIKKSVDDWDITDGLEEVTNSQNEAIKALDKLRNSIDRNTDKIGNKGKEYSDEANHPMPEKRQREILKNNNYTDEDIDNMTPEVRESTAKSLQSTTGAGLSSTADSAETKEGVQDVITAQGTMQGTIDKLNGSLSDTDAAISNDYLNSSYMSDAGLNKEQQDMIMSYYNADKKHNDKIGGISKKQVISMVTDIKNGKYSRSDALAISKFAAKAVGMTDGESAVALEALASGVGEGENAGKGNVNDLYLGLYKAIGNLLTANFNQDLASFDTDSAKYIVDTYFNDTDEEGNPLLDESTISSLEDLAVRTVSDAKNNFDLYNTHLNDIWNLASDMQKNKYLYKKVKGEWEKEDKDNVDWNEAWISAKKKLGYTKHSGADYVPTKGVDYVMINSKPQIMGGIGFNSTTSAASYPNWFSGNHVGGYEIGLNKVPYDNFPALLHKGERVLTAADVSLDDIGRDSLHSVFEKTNNVINNVMQTNTTNSNADVTNAIDSQTDSVVKQLNDIIILLGNLVGGMTNTGYSGNPFSVDSITARTGSIAMGQAINAIS